MSLAAILAPYLPGLRRYARAVTGSQEAGDARVAATLAALVADRSAFPIGIEPRLGLFKAFHSAWADQRAVTAATPDAATIAERPAASTAGARLAQMTPKSRQALLLGAMEGFGTAEICLILQQPEAEVLMLIDDALDEIARQTRTRVLIIEDEPIIAMDIEAIVTDLGHGIIGIAATRHEAMALVAAEAPGLVLADIQLRDGSSGIDAVRQILVKQSVPVIFITGFPERLLTGERPEPTFLITKPFQVAGVRAAIAQALFFNSTAALHA